MAISVELIVYDENKVKTYQSDSLDEIITLLDPSKNNWIDIKNFAEIHKNRIFENHFKIHDLINEDILNINHLPKYEEFENQAFFTMKNCIYSTDDDFIQYSHKSIVLSSNCLISFHLNHNDIFTPVKNRILDNKGRVRKKKIDYLFYLLVDLMINNCFPVLEKLHERIESLEDNLLDNPEKDYIVDILGIKKQFVHLRKFVFPLTDIIQKFKKDELDILEDGNLIYLNDLQDHINHMMATLSTYREMVTGLIDLNTSNQNNNMNKVMKTLTIVATIFIPLTFIAGIYGMNFSNMPGLNYDYGYYIALLTMAFILIAMIVWMKKRKWF